MAQRVVLAYSGGLDTSVGIGWLKDATGKEVVAMAIDVGQGGEDMEVIRQRALDCGAVESVVIDAQSEFADDYIMPALKANALYQKRYPLVSALSRPLIAKYLAKTAKELGADTVAHGCTGKGNDQVRFEASVAAISPDLTSIAPIRDLALTRDKALEYAAEHNLPIAQSKKSPYSIEMVKKMNELAGAHGVGRIDIVEDRLVGIKSREIYEAPAGIALIQAHEELENLTLERDVNRFKKGIEDKWATMVYEGLWFSDLKRSLDVFIDHTQKYVSGEIRLKLRGGRAVVTGRRSEQSLYDFNLATYDTGDSFDSSLAKGFIELWALPSKISARRSHGK